MFTRALVPVLIIVVTFLVARDFARTKREDSLGHTDELGYEIRPFTSGDTRGGRIGESFRESFRTTEPTAGYDVGERSERAGPPAEFQPSRTGSPAGQSSPSGPGRVRIARGKRHVRSRLQLLVIVTTGAVTVVALCVAGLADILGGTRISSSSSSVRDEAFLWSVALGVVIIVALALTARATIAIANSVLQPLHRLRARALALADGRSPDPAPEDVASPDEMGDIARAFEQMRSRISRLGGDEAGLRNKLEVMFANLSHRNQSLVGRQMRLIENLEQGERDTGRRATLFRMNRIAARMHRDAQNLLVLAGHELSIGWNQPMALLNVIKAAMSEVEEGERVSVHPQPEVAVSAPAVNDVVQLLAELIQNATSFSAVDMPVEISGQLLDSGGALISITDRGVGMSAEEMAYANWRLDNPPPGDIEIPKWIGLIVVARLAARRGVRVRLQQAEFGGLTALVWLPDELIARQDAATHPGLTGYATGRPGRGAHELGDATARQSVATARPADLAPPLEETTSASPGRRMLPDDGRQSGQARAAMASRPMSPADPAAAAAAGHGLPGVSADHVPPGVPGDQGAAGQGLVNSGQDASTTVVSASPGTTAGAETGTGRVSVPHGGQPAEERRLPIYDSVESHWFGGGRRTPGSARAAGSRWSSPADEGWHAAETVESPTAGTTAAGLPQRLPKANLLSGAIPATQPVAAPKRSASEVRDRLAGLQRGVTDGRAAASESAKPADDDRS
jgi:signal transduction histidine kinase